MSKEKTNIGVALRRNTKNQNNKGITIIALVITIIVMLILVGASVTVALNGELFKTTKKATDMHIKAEVEEKIQVALELALLDNNGELVYSKLNEKLIKEFGEENLAIVNIGKEYLVIVDDMQFRVSDEKIQFIETSNKEQIELAGDLSKGGKYNGESEETAYRIMCIEDLLEFTNNTSRYRSSYIVLERTLDFEDTSSYNDYLAISTDINRNEEEEPLIQELTTGTGFKPINSFYGTFNGKGNEIRNLYVNTTSDAGFFGSSSPTVCNLGITGEIKTTGENAGGIIGFGGANSNIEIYNCYNLANVESSKRAGGIIAFQHGDQCACLIYNCYNGGRIKAEYAGGIHGYMNGYNGFSIINCYNKGYIEATSSGGGFIGHTRYGIDLYNCYNVGEIYDNGSNADVLVGTIWNSKISVENVYYLNSTLKNNIKVYSKDAISFEEEDVDDIINTFNSYTSEYELNKWKKGEDGYPEFQ